jgi:nucleotide-binding universal stress UspA family protein
VVDVNAPTQPAEGSAAEDMMTALWAEATSHMGQLKRSLRGKPEADTMIREGIPSEEIVEMSRKVDLVILGHPRGRKGWSLFSRRTIDRVMQNAACAVMVVPHPT